jgi:hypothetical protein
MVAQWVARWGLLVAGFVAAVVAVAAELRKARQAEPEAVDDESLPVTAEA